MHVQELREALSRKQERAVYGPNYRAAPAARYLGMGVSTLWAKSKVDPDLAPIHLSVGITVWPQSTLDAFIAKQARRAPE